MTTGIQIDQWLRSFRETCYMQDDYVKIMLGNYDVWTCDTNPVTFAGHNTIDPRHILADFYSTCNQELYNGGPDWTYEFFEIPSGQQVTCPIDCEDHIYDEGLIMFDDNQQAGVVVLYSSDNFNFSE